MELPRQPQPVELTFKGEQVDIDRYRSIIANFIERRSYDICTKQGDDKLTIHPGAVND